MSQIDEHYLALHHSMDILWVVIFLYATSTDKSEEEPPISAVYFTQDFTSRNKKLHVFLTE